MLKSQNSAALEHCLLLAPRQPRSGRDESQRGHTSRALQFQQLAASPGRKIAEHEKKRSLSYCAHVFDVLKETLRTFIKNDGQRRRPGRPVKRPGLERKLLAETHHCGQGC